MKRHDIRPAWRVRHAFIGHACQGGELPTCRRNWC